MYIYIHTHVDKASGVKIVIAVVNPIPDSLSGPYRGEKEGGSRSSWEHYYSMHVLVAGISLCVSR